GVSSTIRNDRTVAWAIGPPLRWLPKRLSTEDMLRDSHSDWHQFRRQVNMLRAFPALLLIILLAACAPLQLPAREATHTVIPTLEAQLSVSPTALVQDLQEFTPSAEATMATGQ